MAEKVRELAGDLVSTGESYEMVCSENEKLGLDARIASATEALVLLATTPDLSGYSIPELQQEVNRRFTVIRAEQETAATVKFAVPSIELFMAARMPDQNTRAFDELQKWVQKRYQGQGVGFSGYWVDTGQSVVRLELDGDLPLHEQLGLLDFLSLIEFTELRVNRRVADTVVKARQIGVFEHTFSEFGSITLAVQADGHAWVLRNHRVTEEFSDLAGALAFVHKHHWYTKESSSSR